MSCGEAQLKRSRYEVRIGIWLRGAGSPPHELEHPFGKADGRRWRIDYAWPDFRVGVEIDGGGRLVGWQRNPRTGQPQPVAVGRHGTATDLEKLNYAAEQGWRILRFNPALLTQPDYVLCAIARTPRASGATLQGTAADYAAHPPPGPVPPDTRGGQGARGGHG